MRIVITNASLAQLGGTEIIVRDLAFGLSQRGHDISIFSPLHGHVSDQIKSRGIQVVNDIWDLSEPPDIIWGHHYLETLMALQRFESAPALFSCHGIEPWEETPLRHPRIKLYVATGDRTQSYIRERVGVKGPETRILFNYVDLQRFGSRPMPMSQTLRNAAIYDRYLDTHQTAEIVRACHDEGLACATFQDLLPPVLKPEEILCSYDLVFAVGKSAIEALASGAAVIICGASGLGELVNRENVRQWQRLNFSAYSGGVPVKREEVRAQIRLYDPDSQAAATEFIRTHASLEAYLDQAEQIASDVADLHCRRGDPCEERRAMTSCCLELKQMLVQMGMELTDAREEITRLQSASSLVTTEKQSWLKPHQVKVEGNSVWQRFLRIGRNLRDGLDCF